MRKENVNEFNQIVSNCQHFSKSGNMNLPKCAQILADISQMLADIGKCRKMFVIF